MWGTPSGGNDTGRVGDTDTGTLSFGHPRILTKRTSLVFSPGLLCLQLVTPFRRECGVPQ